MNVFSSPFSNPLEMEARKCEELAKRVANIGWSMNSTSAFVSVMWKGTPGESLSEKIEKEAFNMVFAAGSLNLAAKAYRDALERELKRQRKEEEKRNSSRSNP